MVTKQKNKINPLEFRGQERVFQIDRDTVLIYTGLHLEDIKPFARLGASNEFPISYINFIDNVLLPERHMWNIGLEEMWLRGALDFGVSKIRYVGSKELLSYINRYFDLENYLSRTSKKTETFHIPVEYKTYQAPNQKEISKEKSSIFYLHTGDFQILVGGNRVLDSTNYFRPRLTIDKEYALLNKILEKLPNKADLKNFSFYYFDGDVISILFNLNSELLAVNPLEEMHYRLFELKINPDLLRMAISYSPYLPGFVEIFRRGDITEQEIAVSNPDMEKLTLLKRIYNFCRPKFFSDGGSLPFAKYVNYYESKTKSHAAITLRTRDDIEDQIKILFPLLSEKENRNFDYIKGPFDLEFIKIDDVKQLKVLDFSNFYLILQGMIEDKKWVNLNLSKNYFPALAKVSYSFKQIKDLGEASDFIIGLLKNTKFEEILQNLINKINSFQSLEDLLSIKDDLYLIRTQAIPKDKILLYNLSEALKLAHFFANEHQELPKDIQTLFFKVMERFSQTKIKISDLYHLSSSFKVHLFIKTGEITACFVSLTEPLWSIRIQYPPDPDNAIELEKEYRKYLKEQHKRIDKGIASPLERTVLEFLEKLLEERIFYNEQRMKLHNLMDVLRPNLELFMETISIKEKKLPFHLKLPYWLRTVVEFLRIPQMIDFIKNITARIFK
ncbi:MAG: hypothetical protein ACK4UJ_04455 [Leptonema sp. (in: bacteria)]